jgi:cation/acetate symporter
MALIVSRFTPAPPKAIVEMVEDIRIPKGAKGAKTH